jgi:hypothetical protein
LLELIDRKQRGKRKGKLFDKRGKNYTRVLNDFMTHYVRTYSDGFTPSTHFQRTMLFGDEVQCSGEILKGFRSGVICNSPLHIDGSRLLTPRASFRKWHSFHWYKLWHHALPMHHLIETLDQTIGTQTLAATTKATHFEEIGTALLTARLRALSDPAWCHYEVVKQENITFVKLFALQSRVHNMNEEVASVLTRQLFYLKGHPNCFAPSRLQRSDAPDDMLESLKHVESLGQISLQDQKLLPSFLECEYDPNDYADGAWLLRTMNGESFLLIVEFR